MTARLQARQGAGELSSGTAKLTRPGVRTRALGTCGAPALRSPVLVPRSARSVDDYAHGRKGAFRRCLGNLGHKMHWSE